MAKPAARKSAPKASVAECEPDAWIQVNKRDKAYLCLKAPLVAGCHVALCYPRKNPQFGLYWPGPPAEFAELVDHFDNQPTAKMRKRKRIPPTALPYRWVGTARSYPPRT